MRRVGIVSIVLVLSCLSRVAATPPIPSDFQQEVQHGFIFAWRIVGTNIEIILDQETTGWVSIGFEPTRVMKDANIIIGYVSGGEAVVEDHFGSGFTTHRSDTALGGTNDATLISGVEEGGRTQIRFRIPLDSGDAYDCSLERNQLVDVIYAWGRDRTDNFRAVHAGHGTVELRL